MKTVTAKEDAEYNFGELIDTGRLEPVVVARYARPMVVVMGVEEYERLKKRAGSAGSGRARKSKAKE